MYRVGNGITLADREVRERIVRSFGSRGQNSRKEATAIALQFDIGASSLPADVKVRLKALAGRHVTTKGLLVLVSRASRSQAENRKTARARLQALLLRAAREPKAREAVPPPADSRLTAKKRRGALKASRRRPVEA